MTAVRRPPDGTPPGLPDGARRNRRNAAPSRPDDPGRASRGQNGRGRVLLVVAEVSAGLGVVLLMVIQAANADWFPPAISVSQYGLGPHGWIFTCWTVDLAVSVLAMVGAGPHARMVDTVRVYALLVAGSIGLLVMGAVRTDAGGAQHSWHAKVHMVGSILALVTLPVGMVFALALATRPWRRAALVLLALSGAALLLVLASAFGVATPGMDPEHSWAFWQAVAVSVDMVFVVVFALAGLQGRRDTGPGAPARIDDTLGHRPASEGGSARSGGPAPAHEIGVPEGVEEFKG